MPPRPNSSPNEILVTTIQLIAEYDVSGVSVDMVAERAGVSKATIYRRWSSRNDLLVEALTYMRRPGANPDTGSLREDLTILLKELVEFLNRPDGGRVFVAFLNAAIRNEKLAAVRRAAAEDARSAYKAAITRAVERGELDRKVNARLLTDLLISPFLYHRIVDNTSARPGDIPRIIDAALTAFGHRSPPAGRARARRGR